LQQNIVKEEMGTDTLRHLALETMNSTYPPDKWLHIFTDSSQIDGYTNAVAGIYCELFSRYMPLGYGMEMNAEKTKVMRISRQPFPVKIMIDQKQLENVESFKYLGSILTKDGKCTCEIKCRTAMAKAAFNKKRALFTSTLDLELRKKLVKCYIWSVALYGAETWTLRAVDQKHLESFEM